jgi:hypothetical protein
VTTVARLSGIPVVVLWVLLALLSLRHCLVAQTTVGTVSDPSGAVVSGADVTITNLATGQIISLTTNLSGAFNSGPLIPGDYKTRVSTNGFSSAEAAVTVLVGNTATVKALPPQN